MADGNWDIIEGLLNARLAELLPNRKIIYENQGGDESNIEELPSEPYLTANFLPGTPIPIEVGDTGRNRNIGTYQVAVNIRQGVGKAEAYEIQKVLTAGFRRGTILSDGSVKVRCVNAYPSSGFETGTRFRVPIVVSWSSDVAN